jgi:hypothetical protein
VATLEKPESFGHQKHRTSLGGIKTPGWDTDWTEQSDQISEEAIETFGKQ